MTAPRLRIRRPARSEKDVGHRHQEPRHQEPVQRKGVTEEEPTPARAFNGRLLSLVLVVVIIIFLAAPTTKIYLEQVAEISALKSSVSTLTQNQKDLQGELERWGDQTYIKQQARDRLFYVEPGERSYTVVGTQPKQPGDTQDLSAEEASEVDTAWTDTLWQSIVDVATEKNPQE